MIQLDPALIARVLFFVRKIVVNAYIETIGGKFFTNGVRQMKDKGISVMIGVFFHCSDRLAGRIVQINGNTADRVALLIQGTQNITAFEGY